VGALPLTVLSHRGASFTTWGRARSSVTPCPGGLVRGARIALSCAASAAQQHIHGIELFRVLQTAPQTLET
jgi:hypothetical protein